MEVFIRRLPESVTRLDLIHFVSNAIRPRWKIFRSGAGLSAVNCEIYKFTNEDTGVVEFHGIARLKSERDAVDAIERLDGAFLKGKFMEVRRFIHRSSAGDRRRGSRTAQPSTSYRDRRRENRRRGHLVIEELHAGATRANFLNQGPASKPDQPASRNTLRV